MANAVEQLVKSNQAARAQGQPYTVGQYLPLDQLRMDGGTQARAGLDNATLAEYTESWQALANRQNGFLDMPLIIVYHDGESYWLADGFHRVVAYRQFLDGGSASASPRAIRAEVRQGTRRDAVLYACGANSTHGLRRTNADKRRAIETILSDDEWKQWSDSEIARRCNVSDKTVATVRADLYPRNSEDSRIVQRGGTTYQQKPPAKESRGATNPPDGAPSNDAPLIPADLKAAGVALTKHGSWWQATGYSGAMNGWTSPAQPWDLVIAAAREEIRKRTTERYQANQDEAKAHVASAQAEIDRIIEKAKPNTSDLPPITIVTKQGQYTLTPTRANGVLALHEAVGAQGWAISHTPSGRRIALFQRKLSADTAFDQLDSLDWAVVAPDGGMQPDMAVQVARVLCQFMDVDQFHERQKRLHELEAAITAAAQPDPAHAEALSEQIAADRIPEASIRIAKCARCGEPRSEYRHLTTYDAGLVPEYGDQVVTLCSSCIPVLMRERKGSAPHDQRAQIVALLQQIAPLIAGITTEDFTSLSQAIADLNECQEGTEARHWLNVGYALCDVEMAS